MADFLMTLRSRIRLASAWVPKLAMTENLTEHQIRRGSASSVDSRTNVLRSWRGETLHSHI